jgi:hypothetical protein
MVYSTPELLLVGAAQNLVLAGVSIGPECRLDNPNPPPHTSEDPELW